MGKLLGTPASASHYEASQCCGILMFGAIGILDLPNLGVVRLKLYIETNCHSWAGHPMRGKIFAVGPLGRLLSLIAIVANVISAVLCLVLTLVTLPLRCTDKAGLNYIFACHFLGSVRNIGVNVLDFFAFECLLVHKLQARRLPPAHHE